MPITLKTNAIKVKNSQGTYQSVDCIKGDPGEITQAEFDELSEDVNNLKSAINAAPTEASGADLIATLLSETMLTESMLNVAGWLIDNLPQNESGVDIVNALALEADRLSTIYDLWLAEKESA